MSRIILTGGIASGKSTLVDELKEYGILIIDIDVISKIVFDENITTIKSMFDTNLDGQKLRSYVGSIIFSDPKMKFQLESFMHPIIRIATKEKEDELRGIPYIIDMPLYFETQHFTDEDYVVLVSVPYDIQLERLMIRNGFSKEEADMRIMSQLPTAIKEKESDYIIKNDGTFDQYKDRIKLMMAEVFPTFVKLR